MLFAATGVAVATPTLPLAITGVIYGAIPAGYTYVGAYIDTLTSIQILAESVATIQNALYPVYATLVSLTALSSSAPAAIAGYVLGSDLYNQFISLSQSSANLSDLFNMYDVLSGTTPPVAYQADNLLFGVPEPSGIAVIVTGVAGLATVWGRRKARRQG